MPLDFIPQSNDLGYFQVYAFGLDRRTFQVEIKEISSKPRLNLAGMRGSNVLGLKGLRTVQMHVSGDSGMSR